MRTPPTLGLALVSCSLATAAPAPDRCPPPELDLRLEAPIRSWDEGVPLGNGKLGGLLWGEANTIRLSLDRGDLWDERPADGMPWGEFTYANLVRLVHEGKDGEVNRIFDHNYGGPHPTKLPAGRLELVFPAAHQARSFALHLATAEGVAEFADGARLTVFFSAERPVALLRLPAPAEARLLPPASVKALGYPPAQPGRDGDLYWFTQEAADGLRYCVCAGSRPAGPETLLAVTVTSTRDGADPLALAKVAVGDALAAGWEAMRPPHVDWWRGFWSQSRVEVPEPDILRHYYLVQYFHGAASRRGAPPMPLQGVWTADSGGLPPWKGDYHNDLNTQMTYIAYQAAGHADEGAAFLDFLWDLLPAFRRFAHDVYGTGGAAVPGVMTLAGQPLGGWPHYSLAPTQGAWLGHLFYLHWRYTADDAFLRDRAYPWCREIAQSLLELLKPDPETGRLVLPLSASPEIFDNSHRAWVRPNSNYDIMCLRTFLLALREMALAAGDAAAAARYGQAAADLGPLHVRADGTLRIAANEDLPGSHRHLSNLIGLHPFNLVTVDGPAADREMIRASLAEWDRFGTGAWCGYSFSWMACVRARVGEAEAALRHLDLFVQAFILRNGFHANGDQTGMGLSGFTYRPFTLEGNFLAAQAVHEMLLQSWSATPGQPDTGVVRLFPATPWRWHEASFDDLRAEGGYRVSARRENNATTWFRIAATRDGVLRLRDTFGGRQPAWDRPGVARVGPDFEVTLKAGDTLEATLAPPAAPPPAPADLAQPVVIDRRAIKPNRLPLRIGADSQGGNRFLGDMARASVFGRRLGADEIAGLADPATPAATVAALPGCVSSWSFASLEADGCPGAGPQPLRAKAVGTVSRVAVAGAPAGYAVRLDGNGFLEVSHTPALDCPDGVTLEAWICPRQLPASGARILDKSPVGAATAYLLDTYPGNSLRLIFRDPHLIHDAKLAPDRWVHVAGTVDGKTGACALYIDGRLVAQP